ncbi:SRPBCC domain-containing protein [Pengzhenrongella phosphoraccumulans]|uniref:SRPBCC family protein n=1 Tax=Pengzhenrongella phosphoraccumulans TaxID=3114394 RepID=UPI00388E02FE
MSDSVSEIDVAASPAAVWETLTVPALVKRWQYGSDLVTDWAVGSPIRFTVQWEGGRFEQWGTVLEFDRPRQLSYSLFAPRPDLADAPENYFTMTYLLTPLEDGGTRVSITQHDPRPGAGEAEADEGAENPVLIELRTVAESQA